MTNSDRLFTSFFQGGFECSTHKRNDGIRLDLIAATRHDQFARQDYRKLTELQIYTAREGLRWHIIERSRGHYDFDTLKPLLEAAQETGVQQVIDVMHFGWPDHLELLSPEFVDSFAAFAFEVARVLNAASVRTPFLAPCNEISFLSWAAGDARCVYPCWFGRAAEVKAQLVRAAVAASAVLKAELPDVRLVWPEPVIHIVGDPQVPGDAVEAESYRRSMFEAWDMVSGRLHPELGGRPEYLDIIGVNFYDRNQWVHHDRVLTPGDPEYRPFHEILLEVDTRYQRPLFVAETGTEDDHRPEWLTYVSAEVRRAITAGADVHGLCLYPILNHPGWDDDRHCCNGLFDYPDESGTRQIYEPLAVELRRQQRLMQEFETGRKIHE